MSEAAVKLGVSNHQIRRLIKQGIPVRVNMFETPGSIIY
jgi:hypothetical protein